MPRLQFNPDAKKVKRLPVVVIASGREPYGDPYTIVESADGRTAKMHIRDDGTVAEDRFNRIAKALGA